MADVVTSVGTGRALHAVHPLLVLGAVGWGTETVVASYFTGHVLFIVSPFYLNACMHVCVLILLR